MFRVVARVSHAGAHDEDYSFYRLHVKTISRMHQSAFGTLSIVEKDQVRSVYITGECVLLGSISIA